MSSDDEHDLLSSHEEGEHHVVLVCASCLQPTPVGVFLYEEELCNVAQTCHSLDVTFLYHGGTIISF